MATAPSLSEEETDFIVANPEIGKHGYLLSGINIESVVAGSSSGMLVPHKTNPPCLVHAFFLVPCLHWVVLAPHMHFQFLSMSH